MIKIVTHSGSFHSDDVFAVATLQLLHKDKEIEIVRTRDESLIATGDYVVDVGGLYDVEKKRFDHHQPGAPIRENGIPYAAFGLIWKEYGVAVCGSQAVADVVEKTLVLPVDAGDVGVNLYDLNEMGVQPFELYQVINSFAPVWGSGGDKDKAFVSAVAWAENLLERIIKQKTAIQTMEAIVAKTYQESKDPRVLVFDVPVSAIAAVQFPEVEVIICPDDPDSNSNWTATTVRKQVDTFEARVHFPQEWAGLRNDELSEKSGISDAVFCHLARFIFVAGSKESVIQAAKAAQ